MAAVAAEAAGVAAPTAEFVVNQPHHRLKGVLQCIVCVGLSAMHANGQSTCIALLATHSFCGVVLHFTAECCTCHEQHMHIRDNEVPCMQDFRMAVKLVVAMLQSAAREERVHVKKHGVHTEKTPNQHRKRRHDGVC